MKRKDKFIRVIIIGIITFCISSIQTKAQAIDTIFTTNEIFAIEVLKNKPGNILLAATFTCVSKSTDFGVSWSISNFDTMPGCSDLSFNTENNNMGFLATGAALSKTTDGGMNWFYTNQLDYTFFVDINPYFPNIIFVWGNEDIGLGPFHFCRSEDSGINWDDSTGDLTVFKPQFHSDSSNIAYANHESSIIKTTDTGITWTDILNVGSGNRFTSLRINISDPDILYSSSIGFLYKTTNGGEDWFHIDSALIAFEPDFLISSIWVDENTSGRLYVGLRNYGNAETGLFLTEDDGKSWKQIYDKAINIIEADNESPRNIYCATNFGAIQLLDTFTVTGVNEVNNLIPEEFHLYQNYPNPFNPTTGIQYAVSNRQFVSLKVYDVLGSQVVTLLNEEQPAGSYEIEFSAIGGSASGGDASALSSGIYFYRLQAGSFVETKKMILLR
ncbi:MAG: T9SS type A sorting domain-containing protein [Ignavibacteria bacterium]|nr:T9SS type A sorting domain-containing protein [Ignavibacteria bacterium]